MNREAVQGKRQYYTHLGNERTLIYPYQAFSGFYFDYDIF